MGALRTTALVVVAACVVLAGCSTGPLGGDSGEPDATTVKNDALAAMDETDTYAVTFEEERSVRTQYQQEATIEGAKVVNRSARRLRATQTTRSGGRSVTVETYVVDRTLYQRSDAFVRQYDSEWISVDAADNFSRTWDVLDTLERHRQILNASEVRLNRTVTRNGTEYHVLAVEPREDELEGTIAELLSGPQAPIDEDDMEVHNATFTFWIHAETDLPAEVTGTLNSSYTLRGQTVNLNQSFAFEYERYGAPADIALPDGADDAVELGGDGRLRTTDRPVEAAGTQLRTADRSAGTTGERPRVSGTTARSAIEPRPRARGH